MRVTPTQEQMAYLASIGATKATVPQPRSLGDEEPKDVHGKCNAPSGQSVQWWVVAVVSLFLLLVLAGLARAEEATQPVSAEVTVASPLAQDNLTTIVGRLTALEEQMSALRDDLNRGDLANQVSSVKGQISLIQGRLAAIQNAYSKDQTDASNAMVSRILSLEAAIDEIQNGLSLTNTAHEAIAADVDERLSAIAERTSKQISAVQDVQSVLVESEVQSLEEDLAMHRNDFIQALIGITALIVLGIGLIATGRLLMEKRIKQLENGVMSSLGELPNHCSVNANKGASTKLALEAYTKNSREKTLRTEPSRPQQQPLPSPAAQMSQIIASAKRFAHIRVKPEMASNAWGLGLATHQGNVRSENQDYGLCFRTGEHDVLIVADGCGGIPHGQHAAYLAATSAAVSVVRAYGTTPRWHSPHVMDVAAKAIMDAAHRLAVEGDKLNITNVRGGLRTTLIVLIGNRRDVGFAYIGDGGGCVIKSSGDVQRFLDPQKASDFAMNVLAASLGPMMEGEPVTGVIKRDAGDVFIVGTDGIFDRVDGEFPKDVLRGCIQYDGDLQKAADHIVGELASFKDAAGYVCDDNLTLGIMCGGDAPRPSPGFWSSNDEQHSPSAVVGGTPLQEDAS